MNSNRLLFLNIGWMKHYKGLPPESDDSIVHGGKHVDKKGWGHEIYNFLPVNRKMYGFVETGYKKNGDRKSINITRIKPDIKKEDKIDNVLVIWTAKKKSKYNDPLEKKGCFVIGWYKNATVYRYYQNDINRCYQNKDKPYPEKCGYFVKAKEEDFRLLPLEHRDKKIYNARRKGAGWMGRSNIWYANSHTPDIQGYREAVIKYIEDYESKCN